MIRICMVLLAFALALAMCMSDFGPVRAQQAQAQQGNSTTNLPTQSTSNVPAPEITASNVLSIVNERDRLYGQRFEAIREAISKAEVATEKRFDSVNEFRGQLKDQAASLAPRNEVDVRFKALEAALTDLRQVHIDSIDSVRNRLTTIEARGEGQSSIWALIAGGVAVAVGLFSLFNSLGKRS